MAMPLAYARDFLIPNGNSFYNLQFMPIMCLQFQVFLTLHHFSLFLAVMPLLHTMQNILLKALINSKERKRHDKAIEDLQQAQMNKLKKTRTIGLH